MENIGISTKPKDCDGATLKQPLANVLDPLAKIDDMEDRTS